MNSGTPHLGIDLGTLRTAATVVRSGVAQVVELGVQGAGSAAVAIVGDRVVTGAEAEQVLSEHADHGVRELQRRFGDTTPVVLDGRPFTADALTAEQLRAVAGAAGVDPGACHLTLTHPATWHDYKRDLLARTANLSGFTDVTLLAAPVAAATAYVAAGHLHVGDTVAVFDLGGTLEASVVRLGEGGPTPVGTPQLLERFGGDVIDQLVFRHVAAALGGALEAMDRSDPAVRRAIARLRVECAAAKERLSTESEASVAVVAPGLDTVVRVTRDEFEAGLRPSITEALNALERAMASAGVTATDLAGVLLVGGGARIPVVGEMVAGHLGRRAIADLDPSTVVALGATAESVLLAAAASAETAESSAPDPAAGTAAEAPSAPTDKEHTMSDKPNSDATADGAATSAPNSIPAPPPPPAKKGVGGKAAGVAAGVAAAAAAVAGAVVYGDDVVEALSGEDGTDDAAAAAAAGAMTADQAERVAEAADDPSMDAFDEVAPQGAAPGVPLEAPSGGGQSFAPPSAPQSESAGGFARSAAPAADPVVDSEPPAPAAVPAAESVPPAPSVDPAFEDARASLLAALDEFEPPAGATPDEVEELKQNLREAIERFDPEPGQSTEDALGELRDQYDSIVTDFVQDQKIDELVQAELAREGSEEEGSDGEGSDGEGAVPGEPVPGEPVPGEGEGSSEGEGIDLPGLELPDLELPGLEVPDLEVPGLEVPGLEVPGLELPDLEVPGGGLPEIDVEPMPMPVVDPDDIVIAPETPEQGGIDGPGLVLDPDLLGGLDGPAIVEPPLDPPLQIDPDVTGSLLPQLDDAFDQLTGDSPVLDIGPKQDDPLDIGPKQDDPLEIDDLLGTGGLEIGPKQDDPLVIDDILGGGTPVLDGLDPIVGGIDDGLAVPGVVNPPVGGLDLGGAGVVVPEIDLGGGLPPLDDPVDVLPDLGNVAADLADEISPNLPTNLEFGVDGI